MQIIHKNQKGAVLIVSLVVLVLVTLLAISTVNSATLLQRMAGNTQGLNSAFQAAENGLVYWLDEFNKDKSKIKFKKEGEFADGSTFEVTAKEVDECSSGSSGNSISAADDNQGISASCFEITSEGKFGASSTEHYLGYATRSLGN